MIDDIDDVVYAYIRLQKPKISEVLDDKGSEDIFAAFLPVGCRIYEEGSINELESV